MKKFRDTIGILFVLVLLGSLYPISKTRRWKVSYIIIGLLLAVFVGEVAYTIYDKSHPYQDCVPATFCRLFPQYSIEQMRKICHTGRDGTPTKQIPIAWKLLSTNPLDVAYSPFQDATKEYHIQFERPYLWSGSFGISNLGHFCIIKFAESNVVFSHSQFEKGTTNYVCTLMDYADFFAHTEYLYCVKELDEKTRLE